ncbi:hypothetical protein ACIBI9_22080 [Nonomuraea sp. NPDC050451]|uniref:hypothetical protein n=1 Tax=Nonomuraea sp. NPDC050451 TaxID=3364364 RepID=UPI0037B5A31D
MLRSSVAPKGDRDFKGWVIDQWLKALRSSVAPKGDRHEISEEGVEFAIELRSSVAPKGDRHFPGDEPSMVYLELRSSVAREGDRHLRYWCGRVWRLQVAILGRPGGRPPQLSIARERLARELRSSVVRRATATRAARADRQGHGVAILGRPGGRPPRSAERA